MSATPTNSHRHIRLKTLPFRNTSLAGGNNPWFSHLYFSDDVPRHQESARLLRENVDFTRYVVAVALQKIQQIADRGTCDGAEGADQKKIFAYISQLAR